MQAPIRAEFSTAEQMQREANRRLSNFKEFDVDFLESVVHEMNCARDEKFRDAAIKILQTLKEEKESWQIVEPILTLSKTPDSVFFGLILMEDMVKKTWRSLPVEDRLYLHKFVKEFSEKTIGSGENIDQSSYRVLSKLNKIICEIAKKEYPINWPDFIADLSNPEKITSEMAIVNNMRIIKFFAEDVFNFSQGKIQQIRLDTIKSNLMTDFARVHSLSMLIFQNFTNKDVINETISCLTAFVKHVPLSYFLDTNLLDVICSSTYLADTKYSSNVLCFLSEFTSRQDISQLGDKISSIFNAVVSVVSGFLPLNIDLNVAYLQMDETEKKFVDSFGNFIEKTFYDRVKKGITIEMPLIVTQYMLMISKTKDGLNFQTYSKFWKEAVSMMDKFSEEEQQQFIHELATGFCENMAKPEEVIIIQDETGNIYREKLKKSQEIKKYQEMQDVLVLLVKKCPKAVPNIMSDLLRKQTGTYGIETENSDDDIDTRYYATNQNWSFKLINSICWSIGAIYNTLNQESEVKFLVSVLRELLNMNEALNEPSSKAVIASNIMYLVGQYPRFLIHNWNFCLTVISKLFEFMHEPFEGVKDMSCDTFAKIVDHCKVQFASTFPESNSVYNPSGSPQLFKFIQDLPHTISELVSYQKISVYESIAKILQAYQIRVMHNQENMPIENPYDLLVTDYVAQIMDIVDLVKGGNLEISKQVYYNQDVLKKLSLSINILGTVGSQAEFPLELTSRILTCLELFYKQCNTIMRQANEDYSTKVFIPHIKTFKKDILNYLKQFVKKTALQAEYFEISQQLLMVILDDYDESPSYFLEAEIINLSTVMLGFEQARPFVKRIVDAILINTLQFIKCDFTELPEHRLYIFEMVLVLVQKHFDAVISLSEVHFRLVIDTVIFALNHILANILEVGLDVLLEIISKILYQEDKAQIFFRIFFFFIIQHMMVLITNTAFRSYLSKHAMIMSTLIHNVKTGFVKIQLDPDMGDREAIANFSKGLSGADVCQRNIESFQKWLNDLVEDYYDQISENDREIFIKGLLAFSAHNDKFLSHVQDFVIEVQERRGDTFVDPFTSQKVEEIEKAMQTNN